MLNPGQQHTTAVLALTALTAPLEALAPQLATNRLIAQQVARVRRWIEACSASTRTKKLSSGAKRDMDAICSGLAPHMEATATMPAIEDRLRRWAELYWAAMGWLSDAVRLCPAYADGRAWAYLETTAYTLGHTLIRLYPGCDEAGTDIFIEVA